MQSAIQKERLSTILTEVKDENTKVISEESSINSFLDSINSLKISLKDKTDKMQGLTQRFEEITWFEADDEDLVSINAIIIRSRELHKGLIKQYIDIHFFKMKGIAKEEISEFKSALDDFREAYQDIASVFFILPNNPELQEITDSLIIYSQYCSLNLLGIITVSFHTSVCRGPARLRINNVK